MKTVPIGTQPLYAGRMTHTQATPLLSRKAVFLGAVPIMLANSAAPMVGLVDTFVIGRYAGTLALASIALGAVIYGIFYWGFGFLRMSTTGLTAQAKGAGRPGDVQAHLFRAVPLGFLIGVLILLAQGLLLPALLPLFPAEPQVSHAAHIYLQARLWGLPATLSSIALMGWFIGLARPSLALYMQIALNVSNAVLSFWFVAGLDWGVYGVGIASSLAEWIGLIGGVLLALREIKNRGGLNRRAISRQSILDFEALKKLGHANSNLLIRTFALNFGFLFFAHAATKQGTVFLAGYHILMQFITMIALVLDSFANVAEARVGAAFGARSEKQFNRAVRLTSEFSFAFALVCALAAFFVGPFVIDFISSDPQVRNSARAYLPFAALAPIVGFGAWQLDGIYIGITRTAAMRNAGLVALFIYILVHAQLAPRYGGAGVWSAFLIYYAARALTMLPAWPGIKRDLRKQ